MPPKGTTNGKKKVVPRMEQKWMMKKGRGVVPKMGQKCMMKKGNVYWSVKNDRFFCTYKKYFVPLHRLYFYGSI